MHAQQEVSFLVMGHAKTDTGKKREIKRNEKRPVRELQSPPRGFMVVERAHGKVNQESCSPLLSTLNSVSFFFFSWFKRSSIPAKFGWSLKCSFFGLCLAR